eukprot:CAMPEP_0172555338 /NCGR_PEP_ID=MMETSP1067-20121228/58364_1 /TAXON_ID=265564 ORGANISM="Thalassiosira punctigera, Strain Tpunct2005C2" /NCGR_SAMPLE_ID=MMETSP1067 /ASSEMBLY_ACC=CAM_ASM_000444 /LENGTH=134 /DNA_ID=CAMNT_0013343853 /DNA_START=56 /DNA_END=457 /DNA_ORIENTATION=-
MKARNNRTAEAKEASCGGKTRTHSKRLEASGREDSRLKIGNVKRLLSIESTTSVRSRLEVVPPTSLRHSIIISKTKGWVGESAAANGFIWALYGWLTDSKPVLYANVVGALLGSYYYFKAFRRVSPPGSSNLPG